MGLGKADLGDGGSQRRCRRLRVYSIYARARVVTPAIPPIVPPTIAPIGACGETFESVETEVAAGDTEAVREAVRSEERNGNILDNALFDHVGVISSCK